MAFDKGFSIYYGIDFISIEILENKIMIEIKNNKKIFDTKNHKK